MHVNDTRIAELLREHAGPGHPVGARPARPRRRLRLFALAFVVLLALPAAGVSHGLIASMHFAHQKTPFNVYSGDAAFKFGGWEQLDFRKGSIRIHVSSVRIDGGTWRIAADVRNDTPYTVLVHRGFSKVRLGYPERVIGFGVAFQPSREVYISGMPSARLTHVPASSATPALPTRLAPHAAWRGVFTGYTLLPRGRPVYITFGRFEALHEWPASRWRVINPDPAFVDGKTFISSHTVVLP